jgi:SAM-dependent methyltransferase
VSDGAFYGADQAAIHHADFGAVAARAGQHLLSIIDPPGTVIDLGCGSGILAAIVSDVGFDVRGYDLSAAMIDLARVNAPKATFEQRAALDVELPSGTAAVTAIGEVANYLTDPRDDLTTLVTRVYDCLRPGGVFLFDLATPGRGGAAGERWALHERGDYAMFVHVVESEGRLDRHMTTFRESQPGLYRRSQEHHVLSLKAVDEVRTILEGAGFAVTTQADYPGEPKSPELPGWCVFEARKPE